MFLFDKYTRKRTALITKFANYLNTPNTYKAAIRRVMETTQLNVEAVNGLILSYVPDVDIEEQVDLQRAALIKYAKITCDIAAGTLSLVSIYTFQRTLKFLESILLGYISETKDAHSKIGTAIAPRAMVRLATITAPTIFVGSYTLLAVVKTDSYARAVAIAPIVLISAAIVLTSGMKSLVGIAVAMEVDHERVPDIKTIVKVVFLVGLMVVSALPGVCTILYLATIVGAKAITGALVVLSSVAMVGIVTMVTEGDNLRAISAVAISAIMGILAKESATITNALPNHYAIAAANEIPIAATILGIALIVDIGALTCSYKMVETVQVALSKLSSTLTSPEVFNDFYKAIPPYISGTNVFTGTESRTTPTDLAGQTQILDQEELRVEALEKNQDQHGVDCEASTQALVAQNNPTAEVGTIVDHIA